MVSLRAVCLLPVAFSLACSWLSSGTAATNEPGWLAPVHVAPPPSDLAASTLGSPTGSSASRPAWASQRSYAPVLAAPDVAALFHAAEATPRLRDEIAGSLLACRIDVRFEEIKNWSLRPRRWAAADLALWIGFGAGAANDASALAVMGPNQSNAAFFAVPAARLVRGDVLDVLVNDRDRLFATDFVDRVGLVFTGTTPLRSSGPITTLECRVVDEAAIAPLLLERAWAADDLLHAWQHGEPDVRGGIEACGAPSELVPRLSELAAVLAWDDARVRSRVERAAAVEHEVLDVCSTRFARWVTSLDRPGVPASLPGTRLGVRVRGRDCSSAVASAAGGCIVTLELTHRGREPFVLAAGAELHPSWLLEVFDERGRPLALRREGRWPDSIAASQPATVALVTGRARPIAQLAPDERATAGEGGAALLQLREREGGRTLWLRLSP